MKQKLKFELPGRPKGRVGLHVCLYGFIMVLLCGAMFCGGMALFRNMPESGSLYADSIDRTGASMGSKKTFTDSAVPVPTEAPEYVPDDENLLRYVNFEELNGINVDCFAWLYVPDTNIDYYVLEEPEDGEYYYLKHDIYKHERSWGSVLAPHGGTEGAHLLLFSHRMKDRGVGFGCLLDFKDPDYLESHKNVYLYSDGMAQRWNIRAVVPAIKTDKVYEYPYSLGSDDYQAMLDWARSQAVAFSGEYPDRNDVTLVLSTCSGTAGGEERLFLLCALDEAYVYPEGFFDEIGTEPVSEDSAELEGGE